MREVRRPLHVFMYAWPGGGASVFILEVAHVPWQRLGSSCPPLPVLDLAVALRIP